MLGTSAWRRALRGTSVAGNRTPGCGRIDTAAAQTQAQYIYSSDKLASSGLLSPCPNVLALGSGSGTRQRLGTLTRHIQGG
jgi:hypothetical protein